MKAQRVSMVPSPMELFQPDTEAPRHLTLHPQSPVPAILRTVFPAFQSHHHHHHKHRGVIFIPHSHPAPKVNQIFSISPPASFLHLPLLVHPHHHCLRAVLYSSPYTSSLLLRQLPQQPSAGGAFLKHKLNHLILQTSKVP